MQCTIRKAKELIREIPSKQKYHKYSKLYGFTTENIRGYYSNLNFKEKKILTVCGSGDHVINAVFLGAEKIDTFDINALTYYFLKLKLSAIKVLFYKEYLTYFLLENNKQAMNYQLYQKIETDLEKDISLFWRELYKEVNYNGYVLRNSNLFNNLYDENEKKIMSNIYLNKENYELLKLKIDGVKITFSCTSLLELANKHNLEYDFIFLSNISDYLNLMFQDNLLENYKEKIVIPLQKKLKKSGKLFFVYQYDIENLKKRSIVDVKEEILYYFPDMKEVTFQSVMGKDKKDRVIYIER